MSHSVEDLLEMSPRLMEGAQRGSNLILVRCPYHKHGQERTPSMAVSLIKPVFFCHGCGESGHISRLLREGGVAQMVIDVAMPRNVGASAYQKPDNLATKIIRNIDPFRGKYVLDDRILDVYRLCPTSLKTAGFTEKTLKHFEVGYDEFNERITFPLRTVFGDLVGISGRTVNGSTRRYKIYDRELKERTDYRVPQTYTMEEVKSAILWHGHIVRPLFFQRDSGKEEIIICEGFKATMWTWQSGKEDVVALVGSYLTETHAELIARATRKVTLMLDNNTAGWKGTHRAGRLLLKKGCEVCVANYPDQREQPDDLLPEELHQALDQKTTLRKWATQHPQPEHLPRLLKQMQYR